MSKNREKFRKPRKTVKNVEKPVRNRQKYRKIVKNVKNLEKNRQKCQKSSKKPLKNVEKS